MNTAPPGVPTTSAYIRRIKSYLKFFPIYHPAGLQTTVAYVHLFHTFLSPREVASGSLSGGTRFESRPGTTMTSPHLNISLIMSEVAGRNKSGSLSGGTRLESRPEITMISPYLNISVLPSKVAVRYASGSLTGGTRFESRLRTTMTSQSIFVFLSHRER